ncbi:MAG TPA: Na+/H+ antiporter NhaA [Streptosporangiaceae bacterium]|nr:Na+/H+ antiporter NhaA [Streptosporangiaceae bacterium]
MSSASSQRTAWARHAATPLRRYVRTETGSAAILLTATIAALIWANVGGGSYEKFWATEFAVRLGPSDLAANLREWVNSGLMAFFFLVAGLEARREFDMGELRARVRLTLPLVVGLSGMIVPIAIYLAINAGRPSAQGWGTAMSTDTAFALGMLALVGSGVPDRVRTYLLTFVIVDDIASIAVIAGAYSGQVDYTALAIGLAVLGLVGLARVVHVRRSTVYALLGVVAWVAFFESGIDPVVVGLVVGLLAVAYPASRPDLERAAARFRRFREQPTAALASSARDEVRTAISPNDQLQQIFHPWTSYLIVPIFALANAGIPVGAGFLARAYTAPITIGIIVGYVAGKPVGTIGSAWLLSAVTRRRIRPPVGWAAVTGTGAIAGIGFTVALLIASLAFTGEQLADAKVGILTAAACASALTWLVFRLTAMLPKPLRLRALFGTTGTLTDLAVPVDSRRDHIRGPAEADVTMVEYGDFECPYCGQAEGAVRELLAGPGSGDIRYVWRHLPLTDVHPHAQLAALGSEAAAQQGRFWEMHDQLLAHQGALRPSDLVGYAASLGLDADRFADDLAAGIGEDRIAEDSDSADLSGVSGTPTFFVNGIRHPGAYDLQTLSTAVRSARARALIAASD